MVAVMADPFSIDSAHSTARDTAEAGRRRPARTEKEEESDIKQKGGMDGGGG